MGSIQITARRLAKASVLCSGAAAFMTSGPTGGIASGALVYNSGGFESPRFSPTFTNSNELTVIGTLRGQDPTPGAVNDPLGGAPWRFSGQNPNSTNSTVSAGPTSVQAVVQATSPAGLSNANSTISGQSVKVDRNSANADGRWAVLPSPGNGINMSAASATQKVIAIDWDMAMPTSGPGTGSIGPFFGMEVYDSKSPGTNSALRVAGFGVEAASGKLVVEAISGTGTGTFVITEGTTSVPITVGTGSHHFTLALNYSGSQTFQVSLDGVVKAANLAFLNAAMFFTDADITAAGFPPAAGFTQNSTGTAYFDNYQINQVPEPTVIGMLGIVGLGAGLRRRRRPTFA